MVMLLFFSCSKQSHAVFYYSWILWYEMQMLVQILYVIVLSENVGIITFKKIDSSLLKKIDCVHHNHS